LSLYEGIVWGMVGPILICVVATLVTFLIAVRAAFTLKDQVVDSGNMRFVYFIVYFSDIVVHVTLSSLVKLKTR